MLEITIRPEQQSDQPSIYCVVKEAFLSAAHADGNEQDLVNQLRQADALTISLVAEKGNEIIGHIAFSPARPSDGSQGWYALGPVAVLPEHQLKGVGSKLINAGMSELESLSASGCILTGNPEYYRRFGFELCPANTPPGQPADYFQVRLIRGHLPSGAIHFHPAFDSVD